MYKTILFDLDDTLIDFQGSQQRSLKRLHAEFYSDIDYTLFETTYKPINRKLWDRVGATENAVTPSEIKDLRFVEIHKALHLDRDATLISEAYEKALGETAEWLPNVKSVIEFLSQKNHFLGIITNGLHHAQYKKYELLELDKWFQSFIVSETVGIAKPHKQIFDLALSNVTPASHRESVLMVGDSLSHDGHGAKNAGIHFCFVKGQQLELQQNKIPITHTIMSVAELPHILGYTAEYNQFSALSA
jgi:2-haloacid dehalogenase